MTMATVDLVRELTSAFQENARSVSYGEGHLLTTPWTLGDGEGVSIYVEQLTDDLFELTDRGLVADTLALAGVDLEAKGAAASWASVKRTLALAPAARNTDQFEISASVDREHLGKALVELGEAILRADGLRVLSRRRQRLSFPDRIMRRAAERDLVVTPKAKVSTRFGGHRQVTCRVEGHDWAFVQAVAAGTNGNEGYDHVRSVFGDAAVSSSRLVAVVASGARLDGWQRRSLEGIGTVVEEPELDQLWERLAA